jgi:uncharacterized protein
MLKWLFGSGSAEISNAAEASSRVSQIGPSIPRAEIEKDKASKTIDTTTLYCSFCGKSQHNVRKLIAGPKVQICDECTGLCCNILAGEDAKSVTDGAFTEQAIKYDTLAQSALRRTVHDVLARVAETGLPGEHHFTITFMTAVPGVRLSPRLIAQYPREMTVILQHQFSNLQVTATGFEVVLSFAGTPEQIGVPFAAIKTFADPSAKFALRFDEPSDSSPKAVGSGQDGNLDNDNPNMEVSIEQISEAIARNPGDANSWCRRGTLYQEQKDFDRALADFDHAVRLNPGEAAFYCSRAEVHRQNGDLDQAIADFDQAIALRPLDTSAIAQRGLALEAKGDLKAAKRVYFSILAIPPQGPHGEQALETAKARLAFLDGSESPS